MIPGLPDIKMLDAEALSDLLEDNLSPPEITSLMYLPFHQSTQAPCGQHANNEPASSQQMGPSSHTQPRLHNRNQN